MRALPLLILLALASGLFADSTFAPRSAFAGVNVVVDDGGIDCIEGSPVQSSWLTIKDAADNAQAGDSIFVCEGIYLEGVVVFNDANVTLTGPGATPENDGVALVRRNVDASGAVIRATAPGFTIQGFEVDATPPGGFSIPGISATAGSLTIADNEVYGSSLVNIDVSGATVPDNVSILRNRIGAGDNFTMICQCTNALIEDNIIEEDGSGSVFIGGAGPVTITGNQFIGTDVGVQANNAVVDDNEFDFTGVFGPGSRMGGNPLTVSDNVFKNSGTSFFAALQIELSQASGVGLESTVATVVRNTFQSTPTAIMLADAQGEEHTVSAVIGGSPADANTFLDAGGTSGDFNFLLTLDRQPENVNAEWNKWGFCTVEEVEAEIYHHPDDPQNGTVDFIPFLNPGNCPTPTNGATPVVTPTATAGGPTVTPQATPIPDLAQGNVDCDEVIGPVDALALFAHNAGLAPQQTDPCPEIGEDFHVAGNSAHPWGDMNCDDVVNTVDGMALLTHLAALPYERDEPCPEVGESLNSGGS